MAETHPSASDEYGRRLNLPRLKKDDNSKNYFPGVMRPIYELEMVEKRAETLDTHILWTKEYVCY